MTQTEMLDSILSEVKAMEKGVMDHFYYASEEQLNHKPEPNKWSALECFAHLNHTNKYYLDGLNKALSASLVKPVEKPYKAGVFGAFMINGLKPKEGAIRFKMKTFNSVKPITERHPGSILKASAVFADFLEDLKSFDTVGLQLKETDGQKVRVKSLIGNALRFRGIDALLFLMAHNERHILQAERAMEGFVDAK